MTSLRFAKMHGCGNDFVMIDDRARQWVGQRAELTRRLCDRRSGLGADGLILIEPASAGGDFTMVYVNADGLDGEMCGNGARCTARFAAHLGLVGDRAAIETAAGLIRAEIEGSEVRLAMTDPQDFVFGRRVGVDGREWIFDCVDTGVPHAVTFVDDLEGIEVERWGRLIRHHRDFAPRGTNVNFVKVGEEGLAMRTYERGVEAETLACGTGAVASALIAHRRYGLVPPIAVLTRGGERLTIDFTVVGAELRQVRLIGPTALVAEGEIAPELLESLTSARPHDAHHPLAQTSS